MRYVRRLRRFWALPAWRRALFVRAWLALVWARLELGALPFRLVAKRPKVSVGRNLADAASVAWAVAAASRLVPGSRCLVRAIAAHRLLAGCGHASELRIGVAKPARVPGPNGLRLDAHAWVEWGGVVLVGVADAAYIPLVHWSGAA